MLGAYPTHRTDQTSLANTAWVDLVDPTDAERSAFEQAFGLRVPTKAELAEIETSSRLQIEKDALYLTAPLIFAADNEPWLLAPTGFVLSKHVLMTVRFAQSAAFDAVIKELGAAEKFEPTLAFVRLLEELVDRMADLLEGSSRDLDDASHVIFRPGNSQPSRLARETAMLRQLMIRTGHTSERMARIHYTLVCLDRMAKFTVERARDWLAPDMTARLHAVSSDIASLVQFAEALVSRVQLLQDAATGIINIDQNDVMKVLTVASGRRDSADLGGRHLRNEFQEHAGTELGVGLPLRVDFGRHYHAAAADLVQVEGLDLIRTISDFGHEARHNGFILKG